MCYSILPCNSPTRFSYHPFICIESPLKKKTVDPKRGEILYQAPNCCPPWDRKKESIRKRATACDGRKAGDQGHSSGMQQTSRRQAETKEKLPSQRRDPFEPTKLFEGWSRMKRSTKPRGPTQQQHGRKWETSTRQVGRKCNIMQPNTPTG